MKEKAVRSPAVKNRGWKLFPIAVAALSALYLVQTVTPLRLDHDVVRYFRLAMSLADGLPLPNVGFPVGYPAIIAALDRIGLGSSFFIVLANCMFLALGLAAAWYLGRGRPESDRQWALLLTMLAVPVVRSIAMPLAEPAYFAVSLLALASMRVATMPRRPGQIWYLLLAVALIAAAVSIRAVGIALVPALVWSCFLCARDRIAGRPSRRLIVAVAAGVILVALGVFAAVTGKMAILAYLDDGASRYSAGGLAGHVFNRLRWTLVGLGELAINLPASKFFFLVPYLPWPGAVVAALLLIGLHGKWRLTPASVYLASYVAILVLWPHYSARLWMPVIPLLMLHAAGTVRELAASGRSLWLVRAYVTCYALGGIAALAYTTRISLSGDKFPSIYGKAGGLVTPGYEAENPHYNEDAATIFHRFDARHKH